MASSSVGQIGGSLCIRVLTLCELGVYTGAGSVYEGTGAGKPPKAAGITAGVIALAIATCEHAVVEDVVAVVVVGDALYVKMRSVGDMPRRAATRIWTRARKKI